MKKNILIIILILIIIILSVLFITKYNKDSESKLGNFDEVIDLNNDENKQKDEDTTNDNNNTNNNNENYTEEDIINYFNDIENEVENESKIDNYKTKFKDYFTNTIDFIFYDKEIKGHKFKDLTNSAKLKIIASAIKIDAKIDEKIPNYKNSLSTKYKDIKSDLVMKYLDLTVSICSNHEQECDKAKELFKEIKSKGKIGLSYIKNIMSKGKNKLKDYYEIYKNS